MPRTIELHSLIGSEQLQFEKLSGDEALSMVSEFELDALSPSPDLDARKLIGTDVTIAIETRHCNTRYLNALVTSFACLGADSGAERRYRYRASLRSWLWLADRNADYKIFQGKSVPDIVKAVLSDYPFPFEMNLIERYAPRPYVVQYGESDFNFISRLCEDEGIYHYCQHGADRHAIVFTDFGHEELPHHSTIPFLAPAERPEVDQEYVFDWNSKLALQPGSYVTDSYDFRQARAQLQQQSIESKEHRHDSAEVFEWSGAYTDRAHGERLALVRRQQQQLDHHIIRASTNVRAIAPGYVFSLCAHPR
jgi:type VI secretion system secreted protein VgrG